MQSVLKMAKEA